MNIGMILIQPMLLPPRQQTLINQLPAIRNHGDVLKPKVWLFAELVFRFHFSHHDDILDADTKGPIFVIPWLVGYHVARGKRDFGILNSCSDADGSFVHIEIGPYAVPGPVTVVQTFFLFEY